MTVMISRAGITFGRNHTKTGRTTGATRDIISDFTSKL